MGTSKTMSSVLPSCLSSPFTDERTDSAAVSSSVSIHGPRGHAPSKPLARAHCPSVRWASRAVRSFAAV